MSIFSQIVEQASATMPFDQAKPVKIYNNKEEIERQQRIAEELERELENEQVSSTIEGLSSKSKPKNKKNIKEEITPKKTTKNKSWGNFMDEDALPSFKEETEDEHQDVRSQAHKINGLLSKLCEGYESRQPSSKNESDLHSDKQIKKNKKRKNMRRKNK